MDDVAALLGLEGLLERKPAKLSGASARTVKGRAIIREPKAYLMDEPLSNLDAKLRVGMRASLAELHARLAVTASIYVTHDQTEAMTLGQRVAVMRDGRIVQVDAPQRLYQDPVDLFVASFIAFALDEPRRCGCRGRRHRLRTVPCPPRRGAPATARCRARNPGNPSRGLRERASPSRLPRIVVAVDVLEELGSDAFVVFRVGAPRISVETRDTPTMRILLAEDDSRFTARVNPVTVGRVGARSSSRSIRPLPLLRPANRNEAPQVTGPRGPADTRPCPAVTSADAGGQAARRRSAGLRRCSTMGKIEISAPASTSGWLVA